MSAAYKSAMLQTFCIPVGDTEDADAASHKLAAKTHVPEPVQGWEQWARDIADIVSVCESEQAIDTVQQRNRELLKAISRERAELYAELGESFSGRRQVIRNRTTAPPAKPKRGKRGQGRDQDRGGAAWLGWCCLALSREHRSRDRRATVRRTGHGSGSTVARYRDASGCRSNARMCGAAPMVGWG